LDDRVLGALAEARALGFLGPGPLDAHLASAEAFAHALGALEGPALDLGSGGGVPGLLLAATFPDVSWVFVDRHRRRTSFLARSVTTLGWASRVTVVRADAEELAHRPEHRSRYAAVVARSFGLPPVTAEIAAGLLRLGGRLFVAEPPTVAPHRWPAVPLATLGLERVSPEGGSVAVFQLRSDPASEVPRAWRMLQRHPAWVVAQDIAEEP
jgi:16S rRNA (guanine527-N7)-methyltransferase